MHLPSKATSATWVWAPAPAVSSKKVWRLSRKRHARVKEQKRKGRRAKRLNKSIKRRSRSSIGCIGIDRTGLGLIVRVFSTTIGNPVATGLVASASDRATRLASPIADDDAYADAADCGNGVGALVSDALVARGTSATRTALKVLRSYPAKPVALIFGSLACGLIAVIVMYLSIQRELTPRI